MDEICAALGGRAAEEIIFGKISTGALSDLEKITKQAYAMALYYGLNEKIGNVSFYDSTGQSEYGFTKPYSEKTAQIIDEEVSKLIEGAYIKTKEIILKNKAELTKLAERLLEKEVIFKEDLEEIFGKRPHEPEPIIIVDDKKEIPETPTSNETVNGVVKKEEEKNNPEIKDPEKATQENPLKLF